MLLMIYYLLPPGTVSSLSQSSGWSTEVLSVYCNASGCIGTRYVTTL